MNAEKPENEMSPEPDPDPVLSIVVTVVDGGEALRCFLDAVEALEDPPPLDVIIPFDESVAEVAGLQATHPRFRFLELGQITPELPLDSAGGQHELYDRRRAAGLAAAEGDLIAILEDRGAPSRNWARQAVLLHREHAHGVIGGAIQGRPDSLLNWAFYVCDFGRYQLPFESGTATWVSDVNVTYKRRILEDTRELWKERYQEPVVHWHLQEKGEQLQLMSELVVEHARPGTSLPMLLPERFHWGRLYGHICARHMSLGKRIVRSLLGPLIPPLLFVRHARTQWRKGKFGAFVQASPFVAILLVVWTLGEVWGYITNRG